MSILKRIFVSIHRRWNKSLLLFFIVFMCGILISASLCVYHATLSLKNNIKAQLGANVVIGYINEPNNILYKYLMQPDVYAVERYQYDQRSQTVFDEIINSYDINASTHDYEKKIIKYYRIKYINDLEGKERLKKREDFICEELINVINRNGSMIKNLFKEELMSCVEQTTNYKKVYIFEKNTTE